jgi:cellulose synthase/poly-beta-1,6-N-acetylglucosamine synthase-like glycosyltransferase
MIQDIEIIKILWAFIILVLIVFLSLRIYLVVWWKRQSSSQKNIALKEVTVIFPCKGVDLNFEKNLDAIKHQTVEQYNIVAVVDHLDDPAVQILKKHDMEILVSDGGHSGSGKVGAIATALKKYQESDYFAILDSDTLVKPNWLQSLLGPLADKNIGASTTYPYYDPADRGNIWDYIKKTWGYLGINMMEFRLTRFVWGGSVAFRNDLIFPDNFEKFANSISDDSTITSICKERNLKIAYAHNTRPVVYTREDRKTFMEWSNRQIAISISHSKNAFYAGIGIYGIVILYVIALIPLSIFVWNLFLLGYIPWGMAIAINVSREKQNIMMVTIASIVLPFIYFINMITGVRSTHIEWRGKKYELKK